MNIFVRSYYGAMCLEALDRDDVRTARKYYEKLGEKALSNMRLIALGARISVMENDSEAALPQLRKALNISESKKSVKAKYVEAYCNYFIHLIERSGQHEKFRKQALTLNVRDFYPRSLPLPGREITLEEVDVLNEEIRRSTFH